MSNATLRLVERLRERIHKTRRRIYFARLTDGGIVTLGICAAALLLALLVEAYFWLPAEGRTLLLGAAAAIVVLAMIIFVGIPLAGLMGFSSALSDESLARQIGTRFSSIGDRLVNLLHLADGRGSISDEELRENAIHDLGEEVEDVRFEEMVSFDSARTSLRWAMIPVAGLLLMGLTAPTMITEAGDRLLSPRTTFERPAPFAWSVAPGDSTVVKGQPLTISARAEGNGLPDRAILQLQREGETRVEETQLRADSTHTFRHRQSAVRQPVRYRLRSGGITSDWHSIRVVEQPMVRQLQISLTPPAYTDLPERTLAPNVGDITALPGTQVQVTVTSDSSELERAHLAFADGDSTALAVEETQARGSFVVQDETNYRVILRNQMGISNANPIRYQIETVTDEHPAIEFRAPEAVADIDQGGQKTLQVRMTDDHGFAQLRLYYRLSESRFDETMSEFDHVDLPLEDPRQLDQLVEYTWQIASETELDPVRGDVIEYYVRVWDNNAVAGYQSDQTATQVLRFPSLAQQYEDVNREQESAGSTLESLQEEAEAMRREFESLQEDVRRQQDGDWENQRSVERLQERQETMEEQAEQLSEQVESMTREMQENNLVSDETLQMYEDLQQVIEEINSPELEEALQELQEAMQNMDFQSMQNALQEFEFNEQEYQQRLERTLELFKKLKAQQQLDEAARRTEELAEQERSLAEQTEQLTEQLDSLGTSGPSGESEEAEESEEPEESGDSGERGESEGSEDAGESGETGESGDTASESSESADDSSSASSQEGQSESSTSSESSDQQEADSSEQDPGSTSEAADRLAEQQERAREEMEAVQERMEELSRQMDEMNQAPNEQFEELMEQMQRQDLPQQMQENTEQLRNQSLDEAQQGQQSLQQQLQELSEQMNQMQQSMRSQQLQVNIAGIRQALEDVLHLSNEQEDLRERVDHVAGDSPVLREVSQKQMSLSEGLSVVNDSLQQLAGQIPQMSRRIQQRSGEALREMSQSVETISERELPQATNHQKGAMEHLNNLALDLSRLLEQLQNMQQQGGGGDMSLQQMMQQLQQMAKQQQNVNDQVQQLLNDMQGNRLSQDQQERLQQMRRQQQQIRRQLEEVHRNSDARNELLGDLERVAEQMEETIRDLREQSVSREMIERQQQIMTRLLQAQQSLQTQGEEERRRGETAGDTPRESPESLPASEDEAEQLRRDLIRALESGYAPDYEELIKRYFKVLQEQDDQ